MEAYGVMEVYLHSILTSVLVVRGLVGPRAGLDAIDKRWIFSFLPGIKPRFLGLLAPTPVTAD
jgi:hypothetical protein